MSEESVGSVSIEQLEVAYKRMGTLIMEMKRSAEVNDKARLIRLGESFMEQGDDILTCFFDSSNITEEDVTKFGSNSIDDSLMIKMASKPDNETFLKKNSEADSRRD